MDPYDAALVPPPFGQTNTGAVCYFNSLWQMLIGCPAFARAVLSTPLPENASRTAIAVREFVEAYTSASASASAVVPAAGTTTVLHALMADLRERRQDSAARFGAGQESASEALLLLLDMMDPPDAAGAAASAAPAASKPISAVTRLFRHRYACTLRCFECRRDVSQTTDHAVNFNLFHMDHLGATGAISTPATFSKALRSIIEPVTDYRCPNCARVTRAARVYSLKMIPEILFCSFNLYDGLGGRFAGHRARYFPERVRIPAAAGGDYVFRLVGQVEHSGGLGGGHYWARGLRSAPAGAPASALASALASAPAGASTYMLNDSHVSPAQFGPSSNTYIIVYNYEGTDGGTDV